MTDVDYYDILGVSKSASNRELKSAYRRLVRRDHPDNGGDARAFLLIQAAYEQLSNPAARAAYDIQHRSRPSRWARLMCGLCDARTAKRPLVVVLAKRFEPDQRIELPVCDPCWSARVPVGGRLARLIDMRANGLYRRVVRYAPVADFVTQGYHVVSCT